MSEIRMSVHRALAELKLLNSKVERELANGVFVLANRTTNRAIKGHTLAEVNAELTGNFDRVKALISNRGKIKSAIVLSNANTFVQIAGEELTVAEAIEKKSSIQLRKNFLTVLKRQYVQNNTVVEKENDQLPSKLETYLSSVLGEKTNRTASDVALHTKVFEDNNRFELIDPRKISVYIRTLEKEIDDFETQVDYVLSESNALTHIEVFLDD